MASAFAIRIACSSRSSPVIRQPVFCATNIAGPPAPQPRSGTLGAELVEVDFRWSAEADRAAQNYLDHLFGGFIKGYVGSEPELASAWALYCANASGNTTVGEFYEAYEMQAKMAHHAGAILDDCYPFICPTMNYHEIPAAQDPADPVVINGKTVDPLYGWCMCHPFTMLGRLPVLSVPSGIGGNGLPTSVQIVARHLDDERVFRVGKALESAQPWLDCAERRPSAGAREVE